MFESLAEAVAWAKKHHPGCSFSVKEQQDGPTIISIKGKGLALRTVVFVKQKKNQEGKADG